MAIPNFLDRRDASAYLLEQWGLKRSVSYLNQMAAKGSGPKFHKAGRAPLYAPADLDDWAKETIGPAVFSNIEHRLLVAAAATTI
jgi:hypothetical protein